MAALLLPFRLARVDVKKGKTQRSLANWLILNALKWSAQDAKAVDTLHEQAQALLDVFPLVKVILATIDFPLRLRRWRVQRVHES